MKVTKKWFALLMVFAMVLSLMPVNTAKASEDENQTSMVTLRFIKSRDIMDKDIKVNEKEFVNELGEPSGNLVIDAVSGETLTIKIVSDANYILLDGRKKRINPSSVSDDKKTRTYTFDESYTARGDNIYIEKAYTVNMPKDFEVIPCEIMGNVSGNATNSFEIANGETVYFKVNGDIPYVFSADDSNIIKRNITSGHMYNFMLNATDKTPDTISVTAKKYCKVSMDKQDLYMKLLVL